MNAEIDSPEAYHAAYAESIAHPQQFWGRVGQTFHWHKPFTQVLTGGFDQVDIRWYADGETNLCYNCLDRHLPALANHTALIWEPNNPAEAARHISFSELHAAVCRFANVLLAEGIKAGDRICLYLPMVPEAAVAMLAAARIGAIHSIVFGGFSAGSLADRINDAECKLLITADGGWRGNKQVPLKAIADEALLNAPSIKRVIVLKRIESLIHWDEKRDRWWHDLEAGAGSHHQAVAQPAEAPLFILYTSGSTGKPKGIVHTTGGYMVYAGYSFRNVFQAKPNEVFWCTADVGWVTGHSYLVYGPLLNGITTVMFEGVPNYPDSGRFWDVVARHKVNIFYTAPTAIRALQAAGDAFVDGKDLSSLRVLGSVGEPINEEAWNWYHKHVGHYRCPIVDTWWQTETGGILISTLAGITPVIPAFATLPLPGIVPILVDEKGHELSGESEGNLCIRQPWPGIARTTWGDAERFRNTYFTTYPGYYFTGDGARRDANGNYRITGRVDDVINVSGHRIGTAEVENALNTHHAIVESAVVGYPHPIKGQGIYAYIILASGNTEDDKLIEMSRHHVAELIGPFARPDVVQVVRGLPKTRSGKIMRRILRKIAEGETENLGDTSTLLDPSVLEEIKAGAAKIT